MKNIPIDLIKSFLRDRTMVSLASAVIVAGIAYSIYIALALEPSDLQVVTRYTAFGDTHFYRSKWYYLLTFIVFGIALMATHISLAIKLYGREQRQLATMLLGFTLFLIAIGWIVARSVLGIAFS